MRKQCRMVTDFLSPTSALLRRYRQLGLVISARARARGFGWSYYHGRGVVVAELKLDLAVNDCLQNWQTQHQRVSIMEWAALSLAVLCAKSLGPAHHGDASRGVAIRAGPWRGPPPMSPQAHTCEHGE